MRVVIAGQKRFGADVLELALQRGCTVVAASAPAEENDRLRMVAARWKIPWIPSTNFNASTMPHGCDVILAAHCHSFLSRRTRFKAELGAVGYHPSLLPRHRGRSAIEWAIRFGDPVTGGSVYWLNDTVDGGPIAAQDWCWIRPGDTPRELWARELAPMGLRLFSRVLDDLDRGVIVQLPQESAHATWEPAIDGVPPLWRPDAPLLGTSKYVIQTAR